VLKFAIIGCGAQGTAIAKYLVKSPRMAEVILADISLEQAERLAERLGSSKACATRCDARNVKDVLKVARASDVVVNAVIPAFNLSIMEAAFKGHADYIDMASGPPYENIPKQLSQNDKWRKAGLVALINAGFSPGITNVLAACAADKLDRVDDILILSADKIKPGTKFLEGKEVLWETWSPETAWLDYVEPPVVYEKGKWRKVQPFYGEEIYEFPPPCGLANITCHAHEEVHTLPRFIKGIRNVYVKFGWMPKALIAKALIELGLFDEKPVRVKGVEIAPRDFFFKLIRPVPTEEEVISKIEADAIIDTVKAFIVEVRGRKAGVKTTYRYSPISEAYADFREAYKKHGKRILEELDVVGVSTAILAHMLGSDEIKARGVYPCEALSHDERKAFLDQLEKEGFRFDEVVVRN
jgi:saccharopine dehydrogenase (NAD+, L-lysine-forming)